MLGCFRGDFLHDGAEEGHSGEAGLCSTGPSVSNETTSLHDLRYKL